MCFGYSGGADVSDLSVVEICAGAGGQSLGLHLAGFRHRLAVEIDPVAASTLRNNLHRFAALSGDEDPEVAVGDVASAATWTPTKYRRVSLLAGGVPCPPFSMAGKQLGASDERDLFAWAVELAGQMKPDAVLLENVRGLSMPRFSAYRQAVLDRFEKLGYAADWHLLEARDFGVPQLRPRFVLVALRSKYAPFFRWPEAKPTTETVGTALYDLMSANGWVGVDEWADKANDIAPTIVGGSKKHGGADLGPTRAKRAWAALGVDGIGVEDAAPGADAPSNFIPKLTTEMVARLQGWAGAEYEWHFEGRKTARYRQIGNAFPPPVARAVGESIASALRQEGARVRRVARDRALHDLVYRLLDDSRRYVGLRRLEQMVDGRLNREQLEQHLDHIGRDFHLHTKVIAGELAVKLGEWRAFRGQDDHERHLAFSDLRQRARIS
jgi:DNA (cytosine-5)-methyltransferase 1